MRSKNAIYNIISNIVLQLIVIVYGFIVPKIIISNFGSNVNGLISSITQFLGYISLLESGFGPVVKSVLYKPIAKKNKKEITSILKASNKFFKTISIVFIAYIIVLLFIYPLIINSEFSQLYTCSLILIIAISTFAEYFFGMTYRLYLQAEQKNYVISIIQIITYILSVIIILILVKFNASIHVIKLVGSLVFVLRPILQNIYVRKKYNIVFDKQKENYKIEKKWDGLAQHIAAVIHSNTDITVLTIFSTLAEVSVYSVYYMVVKGIKALIQSFVNGIDASFGDMIAKDENDRLNKNFDLYETIYHSISTIIYACTLILIVPFVTVYTKGITDVNYIRYTFGYLIVISEFIWAIRLPYSSVTLAAGHFKETRRGAWVEVITNIIISIILVINYGIIGVAIGTIVAMAIRTIEFVYHTNKYILKRSILSSIKKITLVIAETLIIFIVSKTVMNLNVTSYFKWAINAIIVFSYSCVIVFFINFIFYKKSYLEIFKKFKNIKKKNTA